MNGKILYTTNGGNLWQEQISGTSKYILSIFFTDFNNGWAVGVDGIMLHTTNGGVTDIADETPDIISFDLKQNYPNPFNPSTRIQYAISSRQLVTLKIYDILGNEIAILVNEEKPSGRFEVEFNTSNINHHPSSGVYLCRLQTENYSKTIKMLYFK